MRLHLPTLAALAVLAFSASVAAETVIVEMRTMDSHPTFVPAEVTIEPGDTVRWINLDLQTEHSTSNGVGSADPTYGTLWQSPLLRYGEHYDYVFSQPGEFEYFSVPYEYDGMLGLVRVDSGTPVPEPNIEPSTWGLIKRNFAEILPRD